MSGELRGLVTEQILERDMVKICNREVEKPGGRIYFLFLFIVENINQLDHVLVLESP